MNDEFLRMKALLEEAGLSFESGGLSNAELWAYAAGLETAAGLIDYTESVMMMLSEDKNDLARYADLLKIDRERYTADELKAEITRRLSLPFGQSSYTLAEQEFARVKSGEYALTAEQCVVFGAYAGDLREAALFLKAYSPFCAQQRYGGDGDAMTFDLWDSLGYSFNRLDSLEITFDFSDSIRSDIFEQH